MRLPSRVLIALRPWFPGLELERVRVVAGGPVCWFVRTVLRKGAMTVAPFVFLGTRAYEPDDPAFLALLAHEVKHIEQFRRYGYVRFLVRYFWDLGRSGFRYSPRLPLEAEAYELERKFLASLSAQRGPGTA